MNKIKIKYILISLLVLIIATVLVDIVRIFSYDIHPRRPDHDIDSQQNRIYYELANGAKNIDWNRLDGTLEYIESEYDCSDFRLVNLIRILYEYEDRIPDSSKKKIEEVLFGFRYWWSDPGENSMCYWTENHQILFASAEYLIAQRYPQIKFKNSGLIGQELRERAKLRALDWLEMRWKFGFTEYYSNVYYKEDIGAMINLIDFADDQELVQKTKIIMDLLLYDVAAQNIRTMFISTSNRAYRHNRMGGPEATLGGITNYYWGSRKKINPGLMYGMMTSTNYDLPEVIADIGKDTSTVIIKQSNGLDIDELSAEGYYGLDNRSMMMQWCLGAFSNPVVVRNSLAHVRKNRMFSNDFLKDLKILDFTLFRVFHLEPLLTRLINPQENGVAMQRANTYTYKTADYTLYSTLNYHPGAYGDQHHVNGMNIGNAFSVFHTHPAVEKDKVRQSPNYWVGYGHLPHVAQDGNVSLAIYDIPQSKGLMEQALLDYTHAWFPIEKFDSVWVKDNYAFGKKGDTYCVFITRYPLGFRNESDDDLIQPGKQVFWVTEAGSAREDGSFAAFCRRIKENKIDFDADNLVLKYMSREKEYQLTFNGVFLLNGNLVDTEYNRFASKYCQAPRKPETITIKHKGKSLLLDFYNLVRAY
jgi:hypothetical protein